MEEDSKNTLSIYVGQPVLAQIAKYLGKDPVDEIARRHKSDRYVKKFTTYNHLMSMLFGTMSFCESLREIELLLAAQQQKLPHLSIDYKVCRSTLGRANSNRAPEVFEDVYHLLLRRWRTFLRDSCPDTPPVKKLHAIDSTTMTLATGIVFAGTGKPCYADGRQKGGIKAHTMMNVEEGVPHLVKFSKAAKSDSKFMDMIYSLPKNSVITMDRAYCSHDKLEELSLRKIWYVTRLKDNVVYRVMRIFHAADAAEAGAAGERILRDEAVAISLSNGGEHVCRRIECICIVKDRNGTEKEKLLVFLTNNFKHSPQMIAAIYRSRWKVELLFKCIKQNFPLKYFYGDSANAIQNQIWATLISCLLLTVLHRKAERKGKRKWAFSNMLAVVRTLLMSYANIEVLLSDPEMFVRIVSGRAPPEPDLFSMAGIKT
jgi:hypothetical protein